MSRRERKKVDNLGRKIATGVIIVVMLMCISRCTEKIPAGYDGVVYNVNGGVVGEVLTQGWHVVSPMKKITTYTVGIEQGYLTSTKDGDSPDDDSFEVPTSDGKGLKVDLTYTYRFDEERLADTFIRFKGRNGESVKRSFIKPNIMAWTKEVTAKYPVSDILGDKRAQVNVTLSDYLREKFDTYGIIIESVSLIDINPDEVTREAIQKKVNAQQDLELATIEAKTAKINANKKKEVALIKAQQKKETAVIEAEQTKIKAEAKAEAIKIQAEARAEANKKLAQSLTGELLESQKIERWNGALPKISGETTSIIDMNLK